MKKIITALLILGIAANAWAAFKLDTTTWFGSSLTVDTNTENKFLGAEEGGGAFYLERGRIDIKGDTAKDIFGNGVSVRLTADLSALPIVRYAYFDYQFAREFIVSGGVLPVYFGNINYSYQPLHLLIDTTERFFAIVPNTDLGFQISGRLFGQSVETETTTNKWDLLNYTVGLVNGEGHKELFGAGNKNIDNYAFYANLGFNVLPGLSLSASLRYQGISFNAVNSFNTANDLAYNGLFSAVGVYGIPVEFLAEYTARSYSSVLGGTNVVNAYTAGVQLGYGLFDKVLTPYIRYDVYDKNSDESKTNDNGQVLDFGLTFRPVKTGLTLFTAASYWLQKEKTFGNVDYKLRLEYKTSLAAKD